jgi:hypothetical protein
MPEERSKTPATIAAVSPEQQRRLHDLLAMNIDDLDRARLVNHHLNALIRSIDGDDRPKGT